MNNKGQCAKCGGSGTVQPGGVQPDDVYLRSDVTANFKGSSLESVGTLTLKTNNNDTFAIEPSKVTMFGSSLTGSLGFRASNGPSDDGKTLQYDADAQEFKLVESPLTLQQVYDASLPSPAINTEAAPIEIAGGSGTQLSIGATSILPTLSQVYELGGELNEFATVFTRDVFARGTLKIVNGSFSPRYTEFVHTTDGLYVDSQGGGSSFTIGSQNFIVNSGYSQMGRVLLKGDNSSTGPPTSGNIEMYRRDDNLTVKNANGVERVTGMTKTFAPVLSAQSGFLSGSVIEPSFGVVTYLTSQAPFRVRVEFAFDAKDISDTKQSSEIACSYSSNPLIPEASGDVKGSFSGAAILDIEGAGSARAISGHVGQKGSGISIFIIAASADSTDGSGNSYPLSSSTKMGGSVTMYYETATGP